MTASKPIRILLVEDDAFLANIYKAKFTAEDCKVTIADNGQTGLEEAKKKKPDIILLEILLPKMDGFTVLEALKKDRDTAWIPVILLTDLGQKDDVRRGLELGAADYIIKTHFKPAETMIKVKEMLSNRHLTPKGGDSYE